VDNMATFESKFNVGDEVIYDGGDKCAVESVTFHESSCSYRVSDGISTINGVAECNLKPAPKELFILIGEHTHNGVINCLSEARANEFTVNQMANIARSRFNYKNIRQVKLTEIEGE